MLVFLPETVNVFKAKSKTTEIVFITWLNCSIDLWLGFIFKVKKSQNTLKHDNFDTPSCTWISVS